ncbi:hypothetical protein MKJ04_04655 [Pontibacter sp. E15-1]|uniref:hypothetical protein n=1 Tax=Pontibacter sp. E15-1 TaxID=2919918 RepID=UPI001F4F615B|nr:hypothetical protein [Pontibacter sp. E15-1]MCJ8164121.1 hypothetical protein [Pontibacter sp. E15-1]
MMQELLRKGWKMLRRPTLIYHVGNRTYKVFTPYGANHKAAELSGNSGAMQAKFWENQVLAIEPQLFGFAMQRGEPISPVSVEIADAFIAAKLRQALEQPNQWRTVAEGLDFCRLRHLGHKGMCLRLLRKAEEELNTVYLPQTSSHGDLHIDNMVLLDQQTKLIDWSMFNPRGTFVTDYIHYYNNQVKILSKESWTRSILKRHPEIEALASQVGSTPRLLKLAYALARISGETLQSRYLSRVATKQVEKYNYVLTQLQHES